MKTDRIRFVMPDDCEIEECLFEQKSEFEVHAKIILRKTWTAPPWLRPGWIWTNDDDRIDWFWHQRKPSLIDEDCHRWAVPCNNPDFLEQAIKITQCVRFTPPECRSWKESPREIL